MAVRIIEDGTYQVQPIQLDLIRGLVVLSLALAMVPPAVGECGLENGRRQALSGAHTGITCQHSRFTADLVRGRHTRFRYRKIL